MCCFYSERFTLFCCVHTYQQWDLLDLPPFLRNVLRYVRTRRISVKPIYMRSCNGFHSHESPNPPSSRVGDVVAMLQIEFSGIGNHGVAEAAGFQRCKTYTIPKANNSRKKRAIIARFRYGKTEGSSFSERLSSYPMASNALRPVSISFSFCSAVKAESFKASEWFKRYPAMK